MRKKTLFTNKASVCTILLASMSTSVSAQSISINTAEAEPALRYYADPGIAGQPLSDFNFMSAMPSGEETLGTPALSFLSAPQNAFRPQPIILGEPMIEPRGIVRGRDFIYVADAGRDRNHDEPATIWKIDPNTNDIEVFYRGDYLINSKWIFYLNGSNGEADRLIVSDYGEEPVLHQEGTGEGAKIFSITVLPDGSAGEIQTVHLGSPLRSPQGVTVVGDTVIVADVGAGEVANRSDAPEVEFVSGAIFAFPLEGGEPTRLFSDTTFVTLVGVCIYPENGDLYLRIWDIDGGRLDNSQFAWMPHSGFAALYRSKIESVDPLVVGPIELVPIIEEYPINISVESLGSENLILEGFNGTTFSGGKSQTVLSVRNQSEATFLAESDSAFDSVSFRAYATNNQTGAMLELGSFEVEKDPNSIGPVMRDNKHAGAFILPDLARLDASVDGISKSLTLFPPSGGTPSVVWKGEPFGTPMGTQFSWDGTELWVTDMSGGPDGTGAVWRVPVPNAAQRSLMYAPGNAWRIPSASQ